VFFKLNTAFFTAVQDSLKSRKLKEESKKLKAKSIKKCLAWKLNLWSVVGIYFRLYAFRFLL